MTDKPKRGLGRGFDSLISQDFDKTILLSSDDRIEQIPVDKLQASPYQPRRHFDDTALSELAASITEHGVIQPLVVTPAKDGLYTLVAGERRWRASQLAKLKTVPALVRARKELEQLEIALIENVQRVDLSPLEQAVSIARLHEQFNLSHEAIAKRLGKATSTIANTVRLLNLPEAARDALATEKITGGHARAILALKGDEERQAYLLEAIIKHDWSVRQAERFVTSVKEGVQETTKAHARTETQTEETKALTKRIGYPVSLKRTAKGGKLEIGFKTDEELDKIMRMLI